LTAHIRNVINRFAIPLAFILCVSIAIVSAVYLQVKPTVTVEVIGSLKDTGGIGAVTNLTVEVTNHGLSSIEPVFSVLWSQYPYYWKIESGPQYLAEGNSATYQIYADSPDKAIPNYSTFIVRVNDAHSGVYYVSKTMTVDLTSLPMVLNSEFQYWTRDSMWNSAVPFQWTLWPIMGHDDTFSVSYDNISGQMALGMTVNREEPLSDADWTTLQVKQVINFTDTMGVWVYPTFSYEGGNTPRKVYGIEINDETNILWFIFSNKNVGVYDVSEHTRVIVLNTTLDTWSFRQLDILQQYQALNWPIPNRIWFTCLMAGTVNGMYQGYFGNVTIMGN